MIYSVIPPELADAWYDQLVDHYRDNPNVRVIVDRRVGRERRTGDDDLEFRERRLTRERRREGAPAPLPEWFGEPLDPEDARVRAQQHRVLRTAIAELPERQRLILALNVSEELSFTQIAEVLGQDAAEVAELRERAIRSLAAALARSTFRAVGGG